MLTLVPTPIYSEGLLDPKTLEKLKSAQDTSALFVFEDQRPARRRWLKWGLDRSVIDRFEYLNEHNVLEQTEVLHQFLKQGRDVYLFSDAGLPAFCDPGQVLVRRCHESKIEVSATDFSNSVALALAMSGFDHSEFYFAGFLARSKEERKSKITSLFNQTKETFIFMDTSYRLKTIMEELRLLSCQRKIFCAMDLNKETQEYYWGSISKFKLPVEKKEFVMVVESKSE